MAKEISTTIDDYITKCVPEVQPMLQKLRCTIMEAAPKATEKISWGMATFVYHGNLVHFSAEKNHIGFHPSPSAIETFQAELSAYHCSKGTVRFLYEQPIPFDLIRQMVLFRVAEQEALAEAKKDGKKADRVLRPRYPMPDDVAQVLQQEGLTAAYEARPSYQRNDYIGWITQAKRIETREKRTRQMLAELRDGNTYMGMAYPTKK